MNKLKEEKSPYLLQHKDNPVNWMPWGGEALEKAKREGKMLFISIGYSTCHWCHVMNRESFSDREVARVLNDNFIPIKVDREERPDIDKLYMKFSQAMTGGGGWPLNIIATPEEKPLIIFTYLPKESSGRRIGIIDYLNKVNLLWSKEKEGLIEESNHILAEVEKLSKFYYKGEIDKNINKKAWSELDQIFDKDNGGFGKSPKFPMPQYIIYLLGLAKNGNKKALDMSEESLLKMYKGGIFDHIAYGFFRYSVDEQWFLPHFEKMLYDNALLGISYTFAYKITGKEIYKTIAKKIYKFILRDFASPEGAYYSALDAESEGEEGKYYLFSKEEIVNVLGKEDGEKFTRKYDISKEGNFQDMNIPNLIRKDLDKLDDDFDGMLEKLQAYRLKRIAPHRDEKILTAWNGLLIGSLSYAGKIFEDDLYIRRAKEAADFLVDKSLDKDYNLNGIYIDEESYNLGHLDDYSFFIYGLLNLFEANKDEKYLEIAEKLIGKVFLEFKGKKEDVLYYSDRRAEKLILRLRDYYDGAIPSGLSFILISLKKTYKISGRKEYKEKFESLLKDFGGDINKNPLAYVYSLIAYNNFL